MKDFDKTARAYALKNALSHGGQASSGAVISGLFAAGLKKVDMKNYSSKIKDIIEEVNDLSSDEQEKEFDKIRDFLSEREVREGLPELPDVGKKGVVMRIAPSASGALHVMHGINASLSFDYVRKYGGKMIFRIEDTNPENIDAEAYDLIRDDADFLTKGEAEVFIQSDRMDLYYGCAVALIEEGNAYVCECSAENFRKFAKEKKNCPCRKKSVRENILGWEKMLDFENGYKSGEVVLRFKSDMRHPNPAMRDFPLARVNESEHPRAGKKYRVWPLMNLSVSVDDMDMGMTHIIRGKDHRDNAKRQEMIFDVLGKKFPWTGFLGRYHFKDMELSTSKFRKEIESGKYSGWDDPKLPTVQSLKKRGYKPEAFWKMAEHIGLSEVDKTIDSKEFFRVLDSFNE